MVSSGAWCAWDTRYYGDRRTEDGIVILPASDFIRQLAAGDLF